MGVTEQAEDVVGHTGSGSESVTYVIMSTDICGTGCASVVVKSYSCEAKNPVVRKNAAFHANINMPTAKTTEMSDFN